MMERRKAETIAAKCRRNRGGMNLFIEKKKNYDSDNVDDIDPNQAQSE